MLLFLKLHKSIESSTSNEFFLLKELVADHFGQNCFVSKCVHSLRDLLLDLRVSILWIVFHPKAIYWSHVRIRTKEINIEVFVLRDLGPVIRDSTFSVLGHCKVRLFKDRERLLSLHVL